MIKRAKWLVKVVGAQGQLNWAMSDQAMVSLANFGTGILAARYLGIDEFGRFTLMWLVIQFAGGVQFSIINAPMMSIGPRREADSKALYYSSVFFTQLFVTLFLFMIVYVGMYVFEISTPDWHIANLALPLAAATAGALLQDYLRRYFFSVAAARRAFASDLIRYVGQVVILFGLAAIHPEQPKAGDILWIFAFASVVGLVPGLSDARSFHWSGSEVCRTMAEHWRFGRWLVGSVLMSWVQRSIFQITAGMLLGAAAVGALKAVQMLMGTAQIFLQGLENVVPVEAARRYNALGSDALVLYLRHVAAIGGAVVIATSLVFVVAPSFWLGLLYGRAFADYGHLIYWFIISYVLAFLGVPLGAGLRAFHDTRPVFYSYCVGTSVAVIGAYPLTSAFGVAGNAAGSALVGIATQLVLWRAFHRKYTQTLREINNAG